MSISPSRKKLNAKIAELATIEYSDGFFRLVKQALRLAKKIDGDGENTQEIKVCQAIKQNPNHPLDKLSQACEKKPFTGADLWNIIRPTLYASGVGIAFAFCSALLTSFIGGVVGLVVAIACVVAPIIKRLIDAKKERGFLKRIGFLLENLPPKVAPRISQIPGTLLMPPACDPQNSCPAAALPG